MIKTKLLVLAVALLVTMTAIIRGQEEEDQRKSVEIKIHYGFDQWIMSPTVTDDSKSTNPGITKSVFVHLMRAVNPRTGQPYDISEPKFGFDPEDIRHMFRLEKKDFLLGEPILVEHRIELNGPGEWSWSVGGNYRARGRDDNFYFILRRLDGTIVPDIYAPLEGPYFGGGLMGGHTIKKAKPLSYWLGLQRYLDITEPGVYDLFCMTGNKAEFLGETEAIRAELPDEIARNHYVDDKGRLIDRATGQLSLSYQLSINREHEDATSPLRDLLPNTDSSPGIVGKFRITIREGTKSEQQQMVDRWSKIIESHNTREVFDRYQWALSDATWYAKQNHFLPLFEKYIKNYKDRDNTVPDSLHLEGLAMRSDMAAFNVLLLASPPALVNGLFNLHADRIADAIPVCISLLTHKDNQVRAMAENHLHRWMCQSFERDWEGYNWERPTLEEGKKMQPLWQAWWEANKEGFVPRKPSRFDCKEPER